MILKVLWSVFAILSALAMIIALIIDLKKKGLTKESLPDLIIWYGGALFMTILALSPWMGGLASFNN